MSLAHLNKPPTDADIAAAKEFSRDMQSAVPSMLLPAGAGFDETDISDKDMGWFGYAGTGGHPLFYVDEQKLSPEQYFELCMIAVTDDSERNKPGCNFAGHALELVQEAALSPEQYFSLCMAAVKARPSEIGALNYVKKDLLTEKQYREIHRAATDSYTVLPISL
jgi:hypothetical protein